MEFEGAPAEQVFAGRGEVARRCAAHDWSSTSLGPVERWPETLRAVVRTTLESPFPINLWCGPELVLIYNDAYSAVLGAKHPHALGRSGREVWGEIWPQIAPMFERIREGGPPVYAEDAPFVVSRAGEAEPPPGEPNAWFTFALSAVRDERGEIVAFMNVVSETTGRVRAELASEAARAQAERAEARLRDVFAQAPAFLAVLRGENHVVEYANEAYYQLVGRRGLVGKPIFEALPEVVGQGFEDLLKRVLETGEPFIGREVPVTVQRDGQIADVYVDVVYYPIRAANGTPCGVVAHGSDVTEHVRARREAQRARAAAEEANQAKSQFLANMSHEIRTPINAVIGYTDLLDAGLAGPLSERQREFVERVKASSRHLLALVNDVLDLSKVEAGEMPVAREVVTARDVVDSALSIITPQASAVGLEVNEDWHCDPSVQLVGDSDRIRQIMLNLLSNALKFTPRDGSVSVRCRLAEDATAVAALPDAGPWVVIEVEDTGRGIEPEHLPRIFEPFMQAETGPTREQGGTGLGLTISRRLARLMGGDLTVRSQPGAGSCFSLWLTPPAGERRAGPAPAWESASEAALQPQQLPGLAEVGGVLTEAAERLQEELVDRLRMHPDLADVAGADRTELADHTAALLSVVAKLLTLLDYKAGEEAPRRESEEILAMLAARHGRQRRRLGWTRPAVEREYRIVHELLDGFLRREAPRRTVADIPGTLAIVHRLVDQAQAASLAAFMSGGTGTAGPAATA